MHLRRCIHVCARVGARGPDPRLHFRGLVLFDARLHDGADLRRGPVPRAGGKRGRLPAHARGLGLRVLRGAQGAERPRFHGVMAPLFVNHIITQLFRLPQIPQREHAPHEGRVLRF